jgi:hypothetical protein
MVRIIDASRSVTFGLAANEALDAYSEAAVVMQN